MNQVPLIVGAGFAGLLAAHAWPTAVVIDAAPGPMAAHKALLRFRSDAAARLTGTEFRKVMVRKGIFDGEKFVAPNIALCNQYARKTIGLLQDRSIWNIDSVERYVAPESWYEQLLAAVGSRINWGLPHDALGLPLTVSTAPMPVNLKTYQLAQWSADSSHQIEFRRAAIRVKRWRIPNCDVHQTVYFPGPYTAVYRASITGSLLIVEESTRYSDDHQALGWVERAFGIDPESVEPLDSTEQKYGKVDEISAPLRKALLFELTSKCNLYSLGRFATWRNILLDDVVDDIAVIKRLINAQHPYDLRKYASR